MATWTTEDVTTRTRRWIVPATQPWGAALGDIQSATFAAAAAWREHHGLPEGATLPDDALRYHPGDETVIVSFTVEEAAPIPAPSPGAQEAREGP